MVVYSEETNYFNYLYAFYADLYSTSLCDRMTFETCAKKTLISATFCYAS